VRRAGGTNALGASFTGVSSKRLKRLHDSVNTFAPFCLLRPPTSLDIPCGVRRTVCVILGSCDPRKGRTKLDSCTKLIVVQQLSITARR
jgi:hypothetical protein